MNVAYIRVSSVGQNAALQLEALKNKGIEKYFIETVSAKDTNRPKFQDMMEFCREGDSIYIFDFSRLSRSTKDLLETVEELKKRNITLISLKENIDTSTATGKLMVTMIGAINEFERMNILERQREGIALAKAEGKYKGRKEVVIKDFDKYYERYIRREVSKAQLAKELNISRPTLDKLIKELKQKSPKPLI